MAKAKAQDKKTAINPPPELSDSGTDSDSDGSDLPELEDNTTGGGPSGLGTGDNFTVSSLLSCILLRIKILTLRFPS